MKKLIKNGTIVTDSQVFRADLLIEDGKIRLIGENLDTNDAEVIDAAGKYVFPGGVDVHTHMDLQAGKYRAVDDFYDGTVAAACGGTTTIVDHMAFGPKGCSLWHQVEEYHRIADGKARYKKDMRLKAKDQVLLIPNAERQKYFVICKVVSWSSGAIPAD